MRNLLHKTWFYFHRGLYKLGFFKRINLTVSVRINGYKFRIPIIYEFGYHHLLEHEDWFVQLLTKLFPLTSGAFLDVGTNIGQTLLNVCAADSNREYLGFDPNPICYYYCQKLIEKNEFSHCSIYPVGLSDHNGIDTLYLNKDAATGATVLKEFRVNMGSFNKKINVPVFCGDEILKDRDSRMGILKIDVEGAELEVIKGLIHQIELHRPFIIMEILPVYNLESKNGIYRKRRQDELLALLHELGYQIFRINSVENKLHPLQTIEVHGNMGDTNYLLVHTSQCGLIGERDKQLITEHY